MRFKGLWFTALPDQASQLRLDRERREIMDQTRQALGRSLGAGQEYHELVFQDEWAIGPEGLVQSLVSAQPVLIHYSGHGQEKMGLVLQDRQDKVQGLKGEGLAKILANFPSVRVVVLNACETVEHARQLFEGTQVEVVVATTRPIGDRTAIVFAGQFYALLARKMSVGEAFELANQLAVLAVPGDAGVLTLLVRDGLNANEILLDKPATNDSATTTPSAEPPLVLLVNVQEDEQLTGVLGQHLSPQVRMGKLRLKSYINIQPGEPRDEAFERMIKEAKVLVGMISPDMMDENPLRPMLEREMAAGKKQILLVKLRPTMIYSEWLGGRPLLPGKGASKKEPKAVSQYKDSSAVLIEVASDIVTLISQAAAPAKS